MTSAEHMMTDSEDLPSSSGEDHLSEALMEMREGEREASGVEVVQNQFIIDQSDISSLAADHQGTDSFVVDNLL
jgi:hypothetical protein